MREADAGVREVGARRVERLPGPVATLLFPCPVVSTCSPSVSACFSFLSRAFQQLKNF